MKIVAKPIDALVVFKGTEKPIPCRFKYKEADETVREVRIGKILVTEEQRIAGQRTFLYECQSEIDGVMKRYQLKYLVQEARWVLYKI